MLFQIDESVSELFSSGSQTTEDLEALQYLLLGVAEGNHRIAGSRSILRSLSEIQILSPREKRTLERALGRVAEEGRLVHQIKAKGLVVSSEAIIPSAHRSGNQQVITFPLRWFDRMERVLPTVVVGENLSDVKVLKIFGEVGIVLDGMGHLPVKFESVHGGGSTTGVVLGHCSTRNLPCICVVDSDKIAPQSALGQTANSVAAYRNHLIYPLIHVIETQARDLENLLPDSFYIARYGKHAQYKPLAELLNVLTDTEEIDIRAHIDIEKGLVLRDVLTLAQNSYEMQFWKDALNKILLLVQRPIQSFPCHASGMCQYNSRNQCSCVVVCGILANVLEDFVTFSEGKDRFIQKNELDDSVRQEWVRIGSELGSWCCADGRLRS